MKRFIVVTSHQTCPEKLSEISISFVDTVQNHLQAIAKLPNMHICIIDILLNKAYYL